MNTHNDRVSKLPDMKIGRNGQFLTNLPSNGLLISVSGAKDDTSTEVLPFLRPSKRQSNQGPSVRFHALSFLFSVCVVSCIYSHQ